MGNFNFCKSITLKKISKDIICVIFKYKDNLDEKLRIKNRKYNRNHIHKGFKLGEAIEYLIKEKGKNEEFFIDVSKNKELYFGGYDFYQTDLIIQKIINYLYKNTKTQKHNFTFYKQIPNYDTLQSCSQFWGEKKEFNNSLVYIGPNGWGKSKELERIEHYTQQIEDDIDFSILLKITKFNNFEKEYLKKRNYFWFFLIETIGNLFYLEEPITLFKNLKIKLELNERKECILKWKKIYNFSKKIDFKKIWKNTINTIEIRQCFKSKKNKTIENPFSFNWKKWKFKNKINFNKVFDLWIERRKKYFDYYHSDDIFSHKEQDELNELKDKEKLTKQKKTLKNKLKKKKKRKQMIKKSWTTKKRKGRVWWNIWN